MRRANQQTQTNYQRLLNMTESLVSEDDNRIHLPHDFNKDFFSHLFHPETLHAFGVTDEQMIEYLGEDGQLALLSNINTIDDTMVEKLLHVGTPAARSVLVGRARDPADVILYIAVNGSPDEQIDLLMTHLGKFDQNTSPVQDILLRELIINGTDRQKEYIAYNLKSIVSDETRHWVALELYESNNIKIQKALIGNYGDIPDDLKERFLEGWIQTPALHLELSMNLQYIKDDNKRNQYASTIVDQCPADQKREILKNLFRNLPGPIGADVAEQIQKSGILKLNRSKYIKSGRWFDSNGYDTDLEQLLTNLPKLPLNMQITAVSPLAEEIPNKPDGDWVFTIYRWVKCIDRLPAKVQKIVGLKLAELQVDANIASDGENYNQKVEEFISCDFVKKLEKLAPLAPKEISDVALKLAEVAASGDKTKYAAINPFRIQEELGKLLVEGYFSGQVSRTLLSLIPDKYMPMTARTAQLALRAVGFGAGGKQPQPPQ